MARAKRGDLVRVHYTGKLENGRVFDSSDTKDGVEFTIGKGRLIRGFESAVVGMSPGDSRTVMIEADDAYGAHRQDRVGQMNRSQLPTKAKLKVGQRLQMRQQNGNVIVATVKELSASRVTLDANHPLAGEDLTFDIRLVEIM